MYANTVSIAYSGRTAINAIIAITKDPEISFSLDSAAQEIIRAAEKIEKAKLEVRKAELQLKNEELRLKRIMYYGE